jgi:hypothetical protein
MHQLQDLARCGAMTRINCGCPLVGGPQGMRDDTRGEAGGQTRNMNVTATKTGMRIAPLYAM